MVTKKKNVYSAQKQINVIKHIMITIPKCIYTLHYLIFSIIIIENITLTFFISMDLNLVYLINSTIILF